MSSTRKSKRSATSNSNSNSKGSRSSQSATGKPAVSLHKHRTEKKKLKPSEWWAKAWQPLVGVLLTAVGITLLLNPFWPFVQPYTDPTQQSDPGMGDRLPHWLAYEGGAAILGGIFIAVALVWWGFVLRNRINNDSTLWADACPTCHDAHLKRVHRRPLDRVWNALGFPVRRYLCENCGWQGVRIDRSRLHR